MPTPGKLKNIKIRHISLVKMAATGRTVILKSGRADEFVVPILKTDEELGVAYAIVYAPNQEDAHKQHSDSDEIRKAAYYFMANGHAALGESVDHEHDFAPGESFIAESWIVRKNDELFPEDENLGAWAVGVKLSGDDLEAVKKGDYTGVSMGGKGIVEPNVEVAKGLLADRMKNRKWTEVAWAFGDVVHTIVNDTEIKDKKAAIQEATGELVELMKSHNKPKENPAMSLLKTIAKAFGWKNGADVVQGFNTEVAEILKAEKPAQSDLDAAHETAKTALEAMEDTENTAVLKTAYDEAKAKIEKAVTPAAPGDPTEVIKSAVAGAVKDAMTPVAKQLEEVGTTVSGLAARLEKVEKHTGGSQVSPHNGLPVRDPDDEDAVATF